LVSAALRNVVKHLFPLEVLKMSKRMFFATVAMSLLAGVPGLFVFAPEAAAQNVSIAEKTKDAQKLAGYFNLYWDAKAGKLWLEIDKWDSEFLYQSSLAAGVGSNDIGLDRGQLGETRIVRFERSGPKALLVRENFNFRAVSDDKDEQRAVHDSFAESVIWGFTAASEENGRVLVDATDFYLRDAHGVTTALKRRKQGAFKLEGSRSAIYLPNTKNFPLNTEVEAILTFTGDEPGKWVKDVTADATAITVREHHSFVQLPPAGYKARKYDPRSSFYGISYMDYATPVSEPIVKRFTARHRLEKKDLTAAMSDPVEPIIYYLDRGAPEPIRTALLANKSAGDASRQAHLAFAAAQIEQFQKDPMKLELAAPAEPPDGPPIGDDEDFVAFPN
jgi:hypothetical protein